MFDHPGVKETSQQQLKFIVSLPNCGVGNPGLNKNEWATACSDFVINANTFAANAFAGTLGSRSGALTSK